MIRYRGAADAGGLAWTAVERGAEPRRLREGILRDEAAQAQELADLLATAKSSGIDGAFIYTYVMPSYPSSLESAKDAVHRPARHGRCYRAPTITAGGAICAIAS